LVESPEKGCHFCGEPQTEEVQAAKLTVRLDDTKRLRMTVKHVLGGTPFL
jgi:hypothetical protein